ncbi:helix-turn-helix domain-containing protein [Paracoccus sp. MKU1]|uniref:helix-turn-helix domain-containing protein n=1 Tax=Paracoccus sp. MKU1 TaxID=1745182 RepID=UPI0007191532|nr:helix-turn-helix domain-containing protein [Paracoccus sp. MKU1]KRW94339.1 hypothetical protein AQY21_20635 [Paracoccus sp. MKU1]
MGSPDRVAQLETEVAMLRKQVPIPHPAHLPQGVSFTHRVYAVLSAIVAAGGKFVSTSDIFGAAYGDGHRTDKRIIKVYVHKLRRALKEHGVEIESKHGSGYRITGLALLRLQGKEEWK